MKNLIIPKLSSATNVCVVGLLFVVGIFVVASSAYGDSEDKYHKQMKKYRERLDKAEKERRKGDMDDYYKELRKAEKELRKAEEYRHDRRRYEKRGRSRKHNTYNRRKRHRRDGGRGFDFGWLGGLFGGSRRYDYDYPRRFRPACAGTADRDDDYCLWKCRTRHRHRYPPYWCDRGCGRHHRHHYRDYYSSGYRYDRDRYFRPRNFP